MLIKSFRDLEVYKRAISSGMKIFAVTKTFPREEQYNLSDQIRRSSRSVCANCGEAWERRKYRDAFLAKINDCLAECTETRVWLDFALACQYIDRATYSNLDEEYSHIRAMFLSICEHPEKWVLPMNKRASHE